MLIQALCDYYDVLERKGKVVPREYSAVDVSYIISLTPDGKMDNIIDCREKEVIRSAKGKTKEIFRPKTMIMPRRTEKSCINSNIVEHRAEYIFGIAYDEKTETLMASEKKKYAAFAKKNLEFFEDLHDPICEAYKNFIRAWDSEKELENPYLLQIGKLLKLTKFTFCLSGKPGELLHLNESVRSKWEASYETDEDVEIGQCAILGTELPIARVHNKIKGVPDGQASGCSLVGFNNKCDESYGKSQSYNSSISEIAMEHYTQALNYLYSDSKHHTKLYDYMLLHWSASDDDRADDIVNMLMFGNKSAETDEALKTLANGMTQGRIDVDGIDANSDYYIVAIKPNASRLSVKFCYKQRIGEVVKNLAMHQHDLALSEDAKQVSFSRILKELISPKSNKENPNPILSMRLIEAACYGYRYPVALLDTVIRRICSDSDTEDNRFIKMNDVRMGIIKACLNRNNRANGREEEIYMSLNEANTNKAYVCGRLFATLEEIQRRSAKGVKLNRTIKDSYFTAASTRPSITFPKLLDLARHHMKKYEESVYDERQIAKLTGMIGDTFPKVLTLEERGTFMLGYYQQKEDTIEKIKMAKAAKAAKSDDSNEED